MVPSFSKVIPRSQYVPIMIQQPCPGALKGYWDDPVNQVALGKVKTHFLAFFDWDEQDYRDVQYYHVLNASFNEQPHLVGREALIERQCVKVFLVDQDLG